MRTEETLDALETALQGNCGDFYNACREVGVSPAFVTRWKADDPIVRDRLNSAYELGALQLESVAIQRATKGVEEPVFHNGVVCGFKTKHSDTLLQTLLKGRMKETYGADEGGLRSLSVNLNQAIQIMPRADSYEQWLEMAHATEKAEHALLAAPVEDAEYTEIATELLPPELDPAMQDIL